MSCTLQLQLAGEVFFRTDSLGDAFNRVHHSDRKRILEILEVSFRWSHPTSDLVNLLPLLAKIL